MKGRLKSVIALLIGVIFIMLFSNILYADSEIDLTKVTRFKGAPEEAKKYQNGDLVLVKYSDIGSKAVEGYKEAGCGYLVCTKNGTDMNPSLSAPGGVYEVANKKEFDTRNSALTKDNLVLVFGLRKGNNLHASAGWNQDAHMGSNPVQNIPWYYHNSQHQPIAESIKNTVNPFGELMDVIGTYNKNKNKKISAKAKKISENEYVAGPFKELKALSFTVEALENSWSTEQISSINAVTAMVDEAGLSNVNNIECCDVDGNKIEWNEVGTFKGDIYLKIHVKEAPKKGETIEMMAYGKYKYYTGFSFDLIPTGTPDGYDQPLYYQNNDENEDSFLVYLEVTFDDDTTTHKGEKQWECSDKIKNELQDKLALALYKKDVNGNETIVKDADIVLLKDLQGDSFTWENLPKLENGEKYVAKEGKYEGQNFTPLEEGTTTIDGVTFTMRSETKDDKTTITNEGDTTTHRLRKKWIANLTYNCRVYFSLQYKIGEGEFKNCNDGFFSEAVGPEKYDAIELQSLDSSMSVSHPSGDQTSCYVDFPKKFTENDVAQWINLPKKDKNGNLITYRVVEEEKEDSQYTKISEQVEGNVTIIANAPYIEINVHKTWDAIPDGYSTSVTFKLYEKRGNGEKTEVATKTFTYNGNAEGTQYKRTNGEYEYDDNGQKIIESVEPQTVQYNRLFGKKFPLYYIDENSNAQKIEYSIKEFGSDGKEGEGIITYHVNGGYIGAWPSWYQAKGTTFKDGTFYINNMFYQYCKKEITISKEWIIGENVGVSADDFKIQYEVAYAEGNIGGRINDENDSRCTIVGNGTKTFELGGASYLEAKPLLLVWESAVYYKNNKIWSKSDEGDDALNGETTKFSYQIGDKTYKFTIDSLKDGTYGESFAFKNKISVEGEKPKESDLDIDIEKYVVNVFSKYEGDTSLDGKGGESGDLIEPVTQYKDAGMRSKLAKVQRGDEVVFQITVTNKTPKSGVFIDDVDDEFTESINSGDDSQIFRIYIGKDDKGNEKWIKVKHNEQFHGVDYTGSGEYNAYSDSDISVGYHSTDPGVKFPHSEGHVLGGKWDENGLLKIENQYAYYLHSISLNDVIKDGNLTILNVFKGAENSQYVEESDIKNKFNYMEYKEQDNHLDHNGPGNVDVTWTGSTIEFQSGRPYGLGYNESVTFYIVAKVNDNWEEYGDNDLNIVSIGDQGASFVKIRESSATFWHIPWTCKSIKVWDEELGEEVEICSEHSCGNRFDETINYYKVEDENLVVIGDKYDTAGVYLNGYDADIQKQLTNIVPQINKAKTVDDAAGDTGKKAWPQSSNEFWAEDHKVEWSDLLEYTSKVTNKGYNGMTWKYDDSSKDLVEADRKDAKTVFYEGVLVNDYFDENELKYLRDAGFGDGYYNNGALSITPWSSTALWNINRNKKYYKNDGGDGSGGTQGFKLRQGIYTKDGNGGDGLFVGGYKYDAIQTVVTQTPGGSVTNKAELLATKNRNGVTIEFNNKKDQVTHQVREYAADVDKYVANVESKGLMTETDGITNEVQNALGYANKENTNRAWLSDGEKLSDSAHADRGDKITYTVTFKNCSPEANVWKAKLIDNYDKALEYIDFNHAPGWNVLNDEASHTLTMIYVGHDTAEGAEYANDSEWEKIASNQEVSVDIYFQIVDGSEFDDNAPYDNTVRISEVWNRNTRHLVENNQINLIKETSMDRIFVRKLSASIDKFVSKVYGGIEEDVSQECKVTNGQRARNNGLGAPSESSERASNMSSKESFKESNPVQVERGDEVTYRFKVMNTQLFDNNMGGLISYLKIVDEYDTEGLVFMPKSFKVLTSGFEDCVELTSVQNGRLEIEFNPIKNYSTTSAKHLLPAHTSDYWFEYELTFYVTEEPDDIVGKYDKDKYYNHTHITELKNVNGWTWNEEGANNAHKNPQTCEFSGPCNITQLINNNGSDGIVTNAQSSDYIHIKSYNVELDKYIVNVHHTYDDGTEDDYNPDHEWVTSQGGDTSREYWNDGEAQSSFSNSVNKYNDTAKGKKKELYPVQVEKDDIVTYEVKIRNTANNGTAVYVIDVRDIFGTEDDSRLKGGYSGNTGLELLQDETIAANEGQIEIFEYKHDENTSLLRFTPKNQEHMNSKVSSGYGIGNDGYATFKIVVKVNRSNMYLYELTNTAVITDVFNRNSNIGDYTFTTDGTSSWERALQGKGYRVTEGNRSYKAPGGTPVEKITLNRLDTVEGRQEAPKLAENNTIQVCNKIADADYIMMKDLIISGYVWEDTELDATEDGLMTWHENADDIEVGEDRKVEGDVNVYLYRVEPGETTGTLVMSTKIDDYGYYIFGAINGRDKNGNAIGNPVTIHEDNVLVNHHYRYEPIGYKTPIIKSTDVIKDTRTYDIYSNFDNYRIVKANIKDYKNGTTRYLTANYGGYYYYQYYVEFEYNGMKYTHTIYGTDVEVGGTGSRQNEDGQYNLNTSGRATKQSEYWLPWKKSGKADSEFYEYDSDAAEFKTVRNAFNKQFTDVSYNTGWLDDGSKTPLEYNHYRHVSSLEYTDNIQIRARSFVTQWIHGGPTLSGGLYREQKNAYSREVGNLTNTLFFWDSKNTTRSYTHTVGTDEETEYLKFINLGLIQRPQFDMELTKDVNDVQIDINEKTMDYDYTSETIDRGPMKMYNTRTLTHVPGGATGVSIDDAQIPANTTERTDNNKNHIYYYSTDDGYRKIGYEMNLYYADWAYRYGNYSNEAVRNYKYGIRAVNNELDNDSTYAEPYETSEASHSELTAQITYKYTITNSTPEAKYNRDETILGSLNELVDYYQEDLIPNSVGYYVINNANGEMIEGRKGEVSVRYNTKYTTVNGGGAEVSNNSGYTDFNNSSNYNNGLNQFKTCYIASDSLANERLYPGESVDIYLTFNVSRQALQNRTLNLDDVTKYNVAEINSFSTYYDENNSIPPRTEWSVDLDTPGLVDKDSNPGNQSINDLFNINDYEDDTFIVDIHTNLTHTPREINGLVWEDVNYEAKGSAKKNTIITETSQVVGDGIFDETNVYSVNSPFGDRLVDGIKVELIELVDVNGVLYEDRANFGDYSVTNEGNIDKINKQYATSGDAGSTGKYIIKGFIPGNYVVRFIYDGDAPRKDYNGNEMDNDPSYNGQDFKSTRYQAVYENGQLKRINIDDSGYVANIWHDIISDEINSTEGGKIHRSDARDDEVRRMEVIAYSRTINNKVAEELYNPTTSRLKDEVKEHTYMYADTAKVQVEVENRRNVETSDEKYDKQDVIHGWKSAGVMYVVDGFIGDKSGNQVKREYGYGGKTRGNLTHELAVYEFIINDIDFGMELRPKTNIVLEKSISGIRIDTASGDTIVDVEYEPTFSNDGSVATNVKVGAEHIQHIANPGSKFVTKDNDGNLVAFTDPTEIANSDIIPNILQYLYKEKMNNDQGFYYINIDSNLMQGATITITYSMLAKNKSEVDTLGLLTGFNTGEDIYNEVLAVLSEDNSKATHKEGETVFASDYNYVETKRRLNDSLPDYSDASLKVTNNNNAGLDYGYYLGSTYYTGEYHPETYVVETRVDQLIDYVDNDLTFREEDNDKTDFSWRTVGMSELVEGDIQKDVVGQDYANNTYVKNEKVHYVPLGNTDNEIKTIVVNNVDNMLALNTYRVKNLNEKGSRERGRSNIDSAIYHANVQGDRLYVKGSETEDYSNKSVTDYDKLAVGSIFEVVKGEDGIEYAREVTIMDEKAREYETEAKRNIIISTADSSANPNLYEYLIPEKSLYGTKEGYGLNSIIFTTVDENIINSQENVSERTKTAAINIWKALIDYRKGFASTENANTYKWFSDFTGLLLTDPDEDSDGNQRNGTVYNDSYKSAGRELLLKVIRENYIDNDTPGKGSYNGMEYVPESKSYKKINTQTSARINMIATRTISPDTDTEDLSFENMAEIIQFSNEAGRRDANIIVGDTAIWRGAWKATKEGEDKDMTFVSDTESTPLLHKTSENLGGVKYTYDVNKHNVGTYVKVGSTSDSSTTEKILLSPPTGVK